MSTLEKWVEIPHTQDSSRFRERIPLTIPRNDVSDLNSLGSCSQGLCMVGGGNSGTKCLQKMGFFFFGLASPSNSNTFDSSIPSWSMISNSLHPAFDQIAFKSASVSSPFVRYSCLSSASNFEGGCPTIDEAIVASSPPPRSNNRCPSW